MNPYPRAVSHFGLTAMEARAAATRRVLAVPPRQRTVVRLWLPLTPLFVLLAPFALLLAPFGYFAPERFRPNPFAAVLAIGVLLLSLSGTDIDVDTPEALVRLRIF